MIIGLFIGVPKGSRTPVTGVKGQCPRPLDDGDRIRDRIRRTLTGGRNLRYFEGPVKFKSAWYPPWRQVIGIIDVTGA